MGRRPFTAESFFEVHCKKPSIDGLVVLRKIQTEIDHSMLEASVMDRALVDLRINEGDQFLLYLRNLPEKVAEHVQLISGAGTPAALASSECYIRSRATGTMQRAHAVQGSPFEARKLCNQSAPNQSAANTVGRVAMWPQIVGRSILTRDRPRTPRTLEQPWQEVFSIQRKGKRQEQKQGQGQRKERRQVERA